MNYRFIITGLCPDEVGTAAPTNLPTNAPTDMATDNNMATGILPTEDFVLPTDDAEGLA